MNQDRKYDVLTSLDACVDLMMNGDVVPRFGQAEQLADSYLLEMGGSACIFACQCAKLGLKTVGTGLVGGDAFGALVLERLSQAGVDTSFVKVDSVIQTGLGLALCAEEGDRAILTVPGSIDSADPDGIMALLPQSRHLHIASYYLLAKMRPHWANILREAKRLGLTTSLDTNWDPAEKWDGIDELFPLLDIFFPNDYELMAFSGLNEPERAIRKLTESVSLVAAKLGAQGAMACRSGWEIAYCPAMHVTVADTVGAGDTFDGGFLYGFLRGRPIQECLQLGVSCAGMSVQARGGFAGQACLAEAMRRSMLS